MHTFFLICMLWLIMLLTVSSVFEDKKKKKIRYPNRTAVTADLAKEEEARKLAKEFDLPFYDRDI